MFCSHTNIYNFSAYPKITLYSPEQDVNWFLKGCAHANMQVFPGIRIYIFKKQLMLLTVVGLSQQLDALLSDISLRYYLNCGRLMNDLSWKMTGETMSFYVSRKILPGSHWVTSLTQVLSCIAQSYLLWPVQTGACQTRYWHTRDVKGAVLASKSETLELKLRYIQVEIESEHPRPSVALLKPRT